MINVYFLGIDEVLHTKATFKKLIYFIIREEGKKLGEINFVFTDNTTLLEMNVKYLNHEYFTDVITFSRNKRSNLSGDIYISVNQVDINSRKHKVDYLQELVRVSIHGVLHLVGYDDLTTEEKKFMREKEDKYLYLFNIEEIITR